MEMKSGYTPKQTAVAIALSAIFGSVSPLASAAILNATADYDIGAGPTSDSDGPSGTSVDILDSEFSPTGDVFYHTYGNAGGNFGSRVSGSRTFDITSTFNYSDMFTNNSGISQDYFFDFTIVPGEISTGGPLQASEMLFASYDIDVLLTTILGTTTIFESAASITTDITGSVFSGSGTSLGGTLGVGSSSYFWNEYTDSLALGSFAAGEDFSIEYILTTSASGNVASNSLSCSFFGGPDGQGIIDGGFDGGEGGGCSAIARSGDPLTVGGAGNTFSLSSQASQTTNVPEPGTLILMGAGLAGMSGFRRKKKAGKSES